MKLKVCHIITDLSIGGAEMMLYKLLSKSNRHRFEYQVVSLTNMGPLGNQIQELGISVFSLNMQNAIPSIRSFRELVKLLRYNRPDVIQTWMYHSDLLGSCASLCAGRIPSIWNVRQSNLEPEMNKRTTILVIKICAKLSFMLPQLIICNSEVVRDIHISKGYKKSKMYVIPNGFDLEAFQPCPDARKLVRLELGLSEDAAIIGLVARFDPQKDHRTFIRAAGLILQEFPNLYFMLCGHGVCWDNPDLVTWIKEAGIKDNVHLLGSRQDIPRLMSALDIASLSSLGEGFSNVIGEAMACEVPCVVTNVGDSAFIIGDTGIVVEPGDPNALAKGWASLLALEPAQRKELGIRARKRVKQYFNLPDIVKKYETSYEEIGGHVRY